MTNEEHIVRAFKGTCGNILIRIEEALKVTERVFKDSNLDRSYYQDIGKTLFYLANALEREGEKWLHMK